MPDSVRTKEFLIETVSLEERIRRRAYERYVARGGKPGSQLDDWLQSEEEFREALERAIDEADEESFPASDSPALEEVKLFSVADHLLPLRPAAHRG